MKAPNIQGVIATVVGKRINSFQFFLNSWNPCFLINEDFKKAKQCWLVCVEDGGQGESDVTWHWALRKVPPMLSSVLWTHGFWTFSNPPCVPGLPLSMRSSEKVWYRAPYPPVALSCPFCPPPLLFLWHAPRETFKTFILASWPALFYYSKRKRDKHKQKVTRFLF